MFGGVTEEAAAAGEEMNHITEVEMKMEEEKGNED